MIAYLILVACVVIASGVFVYRDDEDRWLATLMASLFSAAILGLGFVVIDIVYERLAFVSITACEAKRMQPRRQSLSATVVCVPAYRATKADTLTIQTPDLRR